MARVTLEDAFGTTFRTVFGNLGTYARTQGVLLLVTILVPLVVSLASVGATLDVLPSMADPQPEDIAAMMAAMGPLMLVGLLVEVGVFLVGVAAYGVGIVVTVAVLNGQRPSLSEAWAQVRPRYGNLLGTTLLPLLLVLAVSVGAAIVGVGATLAAEALGVMLLFLLVVGILVAAVYLAVRWCVAGVVSLLERRGVLDNFGRASELTSGSRGIIFAIFLLYVVGVFVLFFVLSIPLSLMQLGSLMGSDAFDPSNPDALEDALAPTAAMQVLSTLLFAPLQILLSFLVAALTVVLYWRLAPPAAPPAAPIESAPWPGDPPAPPQPPVG